MSERPWSTDWDELEEKSRWLRQIFEAIERDKESLRADRDAKAARVAELEKDAMRYRYLKCCKYVAFNRDALSTETSLRSSEPLMYALDISVDHWMSRVKMQSYEIEKTITEALSNQRGEKA